MDWDKWWFYNEFGGLADWVNNNVVDGFDGAGSYQPDAGPIASCATGKLCRNHYGSGE
mgnify:CR=1 FL=1